MNGEVRILYFVPAPGWSAVFLTDEPPWYRLEPLAFWAIAEVNGRPAPVGVILHRLREATLCIEDPDFFEYADSELITQADRARWRSLDPESTGRRLHYREVGRIDCVHFPLLFNGALEDET